MLLLDPALADPVVLQSTARPWHDVGYTVEYRRFYPHLTRQDLERYRTVIVLGGREPEGPSDGLSAGDLAILNEWLGKGGVVVLGYAGDGEGYLDRWIANRWLESLGAGLAIGDRVVEDTATRRPAVPLAQPWAEAQRVGDENGGRPASDSNSTTPSEYTSVRPSTSGAPAACSGLMYSSVPTTNPLRVTRSSPECAMARAIPRSTSTAPCGESTMLSGLMSRWAMPCSWA